MQSHAGLFPRPLFLNIVGVLPQDHKVLQNTVLDGDKLFRCKLSPLAVADQNRRSVSLEPCDLLWLAGLTNNVNGLSDSYIQRHWFQFVIELYRMIATTKRNLGYMERVRKQMKQWYFPRRVLLMSSKETRKVKRPAIPTFETRKRSLQQGWIESIPFPMQRRPCANLMSKMGSLSLLQQLANFLKMSAKRELLVPAPTKPRQMMALYAISVSVSQASLQSRSMTLILALERLKSARARGTTLFFSDLEKWRMWLRSLIAISLPISQLDASKARPRMAVSLYLSSLRHQCIRFCTFSTFPVPTKAVLVIKISINFLIGWSITCRASKVASHLFCWPIKSKARPTPKYLAK